MNTSFSKKLKTTAKISNINLIAVTVLVTAMYMFNGIQAVRGTDVDGIMSVITGFGFGAFYATFTFISVNSMFFSHIRQLCTLPFTKEDIKDISLFNIFYHSLIFTVVQCVMLAVVQASAIPHFICINLANGAFSIGYLLLCLCDKRNWDVQTAQKNQMTRGQKERILTVMILIMLGSMTVTILMFFFAWSKSLAESAGVLAAAAAAALIAIAVEVTVYKKKKIEF